MVTLPTLLQLYNGIVNDLQSEYGVNISTKQKVTLRVIASVQAGKIWLLYKYIGFVQRNIWPDTALSELFGGTLERFGRIRLGRNPFSAVAGQYSVTVTGTIGAIIPNQLQFKSNDDSLNPGIIYILDNSYTLVSGPNTITLRSLTGGLNSKLSIGDTLTAVSPIPLVNSVVTVAAEVVQPLSAESIEDYRSKILLSFRLEAQGGSPGDYRIWASDAQGQKAVYPYAKTGETNANIIYVEATVADSIDMRGTPSQAIIDAVEAVIEFSPDTTLPPYDRGRKPSTVINYYEPITVQEVVITINGSSFTNSQKANITSALTNAVNLTRPFVPGGDIIQNQNDILSVNKINGVIYSVLPGAVYGLVEMEIDSVLLDSEQFLLGNIPYLDSVVFA